MTVPAPQLATDRSTRSLPALRAEKGVWIAAALVCAAYIAVIASLTSLPMQDYPNHVARATIMADILFNHGLHFGRFFEVHLAPVPYILPDLILTIAVAVFGAHVGAGVFIGLVLLCLPCALLFYGSVTELPWNTRLFAFMAGLYLSTDWFFQMGFFAFRLAVALFVVCLAMTELLRRRRSMFRFIAYVAVLVAGYFTHLAAPVFMGAAVGVTGLVRLRLKTTSLSRELGLLAPIAALLAFYLAVKTPTGSTISSWHEDLAAQGLRHLIGTKMRGLLAEFTAFDWGLALPTLIAFAALLLVSVRRYLTRSNLAQPAVIEQLALATAFVGVYFVLPSEYVDAKYVDVRALAIVTLSLLLACLRLPDGASTSGRASITSRMLQLATLFAAANLVYVALPLARNNGWINRYRAVMATIPADSFVLPIKTETVRQHLLHISSFVELDRGAITPYLFSANSDAPTVYFSYSHRPYAPDQQWYRAHLSHVADGSTPDVDWGQISCDYDYILVTMPFDSRLIGAPTTTIASNEAAALLAIDKRSCKSRSQSTAM